MNEEPSGNIGAPSLPDDRLGHLASFLRELAAALHVSGMPAHDLELNLNDVGRRLGVAVESFAVLTMVTLTVRDADGARCFEMIRLRPYDYNLSRLIALEALLREIDDGARLGRYRERLRAIMATPARWSGIPFLAFGFLLSASFAVLLGGGWNEALCAGLIGFAFVGGHAALARFDRLRPAIPVILCALAAILAELLTVALPAQDGFITAIAGVVLLLPGFTLTVAISELATQNLISGTSRLAGAFLLLVMMVAGLAIGSRIGTHLLPSPPALASAPLSAWFVWPAVAVLGASQLGMLQAPLRSLPTLVGGSLLAWAVYSAVGALLGNLVGAFAGALALATAGHAYAVVSGKPDILVKIPGLITLLPGSMGFRGVHALLEQEGGAGVGLVTEMMLTGAVLAVGLLLADNLAPALFARRRPSGARQRSGSA